MPLLKQDKALRVAVVIPCYKRPEYTEKCLEAISNAQSYENVTFFLCDDGSNDGTFDLLEAFSSAESLVLQNETNEGLRDVLIDFFDWLEDDYDVIAKMDNDCIVPKNWLNDLIKVLKETDVDIISPNVMPSNAAHKYGKDDEDEKGYRSADVIGGLWCMKASLVKAVEFGEYRTEGLKGAVAILRQIINMTDAKVGWTTKVTFDDIGHWSGNHPDHVKSEEHLNYSNEVGREIAWSVQ